MTPKLKALKVEIRHLLGIPGEVVIEPGKVNLIHGRNAVGKSSLVEALQVALGGGNLAKLARVNAADDEQPEVVVVLDEDGQQKRIERKGDKLRVRAQVGDTAGLEDVRKPQAWLSAKVDARGWNPLDFVQADDKARAALVLEAIALPFEPAEAEEAAGVRIRDFGPIPAGLSAFDGIAMLRESIFRARTGVNRDAKGKGEAAEQLKRSIPAELPADRRARIATLDDEVSTAAVEIAAHEQNAEATHSAGQDRIKAAFQAEMRKLRNDHERWAEAKKAALAAEIAKMHDEIEAKVAEMRTDSENQLDRLAGDLEAARTIIGTARDGLGQQREELARLRAQAESAAKGHALREQADGFESEAGRLVAESERLTKALESLDAYRAQLASRIPVPGLTIEDGVVKVNGVRFDQINTAAQYDVGVQLAILRGQRVGLPCVFVDRAESLDSENLALLIDRLKAAPDVVAFVARVDDTPGLSIESV